jgi:hypothetical protein
MLFAGFSGWSTTRFAHGRFSSRLTTSRFFGGESATIRSPSHPFSATKFFSLSSNRLFFMTFLERASGLIPFNKLYQTMLENPYLVPFLLGRNPQPLDIWHGSNLERIEYAVEVPQELLSLWDDVALRWAQEVTEHPVVVEKVARYVAIHRELKSEARGPRRSALVHESLALKKTAVLSH